jgi:glucose/arabinose dehydrogenase
MRRTWVFAVSLVIVGLALVSSQPGGRRASAQAGGPSMTVPNLGVRPAAEGFVTPISIAFLGAGDMLVLEKNTGRVRRVVNGVVQSTVLDLAVNNASERGLLGVALHPDFPDDPGVYLFWSCRSTVPPDSDPFTPEEQRCSEANMFGADTGDILEVPLLGNRVDRFTWDGSALQHDHNLVQLLSFQNDGAPDPPGQNDQAQPPRGNHDGGVLAFGPDGKLYVLFGDAGRRGQLQNLPSGPTQTGLGPTVPDDQFGGPAPDDAHFTGVILRLNDDGSTPSDNPLFAAGAAIGGEAGANIQKVFAYGVRNSFGMAFDPLSGNLWDQENGEDAFDELNLVEPGMNSGWIQIIGPAARVPEYKLIETTSLHHEDFPNLQQFRWGPERIADSPQEALSRLFVLPGSRYSDPEFSWKHVLAPAAIGFLDSTALGPQYFGDLFVGFSVPEPLGGPLFRFNLTGNRRKIGVDDPRLEDRVADNATFHDMTESESLLVGRDFGVVTDIKTGPNGNLFVVSLDRGTVYEIFRTNGGGKFNSPGKKKPKANGK